MSDFDTNNFDDFEEEPTVDEPRSSGNNRTFLIAIGVIAGLFVIGLIGLGVYAALVLPRQNAIRMQEAAVINAQNTATSQAATELAFAQALLLTPSVTSSPTATLEPSPTPVVVFATNTLEPTLEVVDTATPDFAAVGGDPISRTETVAALLTMAAGGGDGGAGVGTTTTTALPTTGFADEVGLPGLLGLSVLLVAVIFFVRRMRVSGSHG